MVTSQGQAQGEGSPGVIRSGVERGGGGVGVVLRCGWVFGVVWVLLLCDRVYSEVGRVGTKTGWGGGFKGMMWGILGGGGGGGIKWGGGG